MFSFDACGKNIFPLMFKKFRIRDYVGIGMVLSLREPGDTLPKVEARVEATNLSPTERRPSLLLLGVPTY